MARQTAKRIQTLRAPEPLDDLYRRYAGWLKAMLRRRFDRDQVDDLVQETYLRVGPYVSREDIRHPQGLLLRIAENLAINEAKSRKRMRAYAQHATLIPNSAAQSAAQLEAILLQEVIASLPEIYRDVFVLNRFAGLSYAEIATRRQLSLKTVEWRMSKALALCAARLRD
ncbi:sigma-70 family RNA polymerase sigma factor [Phenylobacterium sp.]|uniref:RNA polymerase sigma factor n=1 Tax=Phenylobacterium sp. TaxID=1871053 RepID=UPI00286D5ECF|nr:sigma-70 family RNA polymerase sigma factor [Phenylobacterium sp.]